MRARKTLQNIRCVSERYTKQNIALLKFLLKSHMDHEVYEPIVEQAWTFDLFDDFLFFQIPEREHQEWLESAGFPVDPKTGKADTDHENFEYDNPQNFHNLSKFEREHFAEWFINSLDTIDMPPQAFFEFVDKHLLKRNTWLVHFTRYDPVDIASQGFTMGAPDISKLALTTWVEQEAKKMGGYNFAFRADSGDAEDAARAGDSMYGENGVFFQSSGVSAYHAGDRQEQIIFWGDDVDPRDMVVFEKWRGDYRVLPHPLAQRHTRKGRDEPVIEFAHFEPMVDWVKKNIRQYSKIITGR